MAKRRKAAVPFELMLLNPAKPSRALLNPMVVGELASPLLDRTMHRDERLKVYLQTRLIDHDGSPGFVIDSFAMSSVIEYLERQSTIRQRLERELNKARAIWLDGEEEAGRADMWSDSRIRYLLVSRSFLEGRARATATESEIATGSPAAQPTVLMIGIEVDWDQEHHVRTALFNNGRFIRLDVEGG